MKKLFLTMTALLAVFIMAAAQERPTTQIGQTLNLRAAQGEVINNASVSSLISILGYDKDNMNGMSFYLVKDLSLITKVNGSINLSSFEYISSGTNRATSVPITITKEATYQQNTNNLIFFSFDLTYQGSTREEVIDFYIVGSLGSIAADYDLLAIPVRLETYNAFRQLDYPEISGDLSDFLYEDDAEPLYLAQIDNSGFSIALNLTPTYNETYNEISGDNNNPISLLTSVQSEQFVTGKKFFLFEKSGIYYLTDERGEVFVFWSNEYDQEDFNYHMYLAHPLQLGDNPFALKVQPLSDGVAIKANSTFKGNDVCVYLYYDEASKSFKLTGNVADNSTNDELYKLHLNYEKVLKDKTPFFQPHNEQVTSIEGGQSGDFEQSLNPTIIEMTFDDEVDAVDGKPVDKDGIPLVQSDLFKIEIVDQNGNVLKSSADRPAANIRIPKLPQSPLINSTSVKSGARNVVQVQLNSSYLDASAYNSQSAPSPKRVSPWKLPQSPLINSTGVKITAQNGAIRYASASNAALDYGTASGPTAAPRRTSTQGSSDDQDTSTPPFAFEYYVVASNQSIPDSIKNKITNPNTYSNRVDIKVSKHGIMTYLTENINAGSTKQLKFYRVTEVAVGEITLKEIKGVARGPMMIIGDPGRKVTVDKGDNPKFYANNFLRSCDPAGGNMSNIPYRYYYYDESNQNWEWTTDQAFNYLFGTIDGEDLGFHYLPVTQNGWMNPYEKSIVYLHSNINITPNIGAGNVMPVKMRLPDGSEFGDIPTGIINLETNASAFDKANSRLFNIMGQQVNENYRGVVVRHGKKVINK